MQTTLFHFTSDNIEASTSVNQLYSHLQKKMRVTMHRFSRIVCANNTHPRKTFIYDIQKEQVTSEDANNYEMNYGYELRDGCIAIGTQSQGLVILNPVTGRLDCRDRRKYIYALLQIGDTLLCESECSVVQYDLKNNTFTDDLLTTTINDTCSFVRCSNDIIITAGAKICVYDTSLTLRHSFLSQVPQNHSTTITYYDLLPLSDNKILAARSEGNIDLIDLKAQSVTLFRETKKSYISPVYFVKLESGNVAVKYDDGEIEIIDQRGNLVLSIEKATDTVVTSKIAEVAPNVLACLHESNLNYWCAQTGNLLKQVDLDATSLITFLK